MYYALVIAAALGIAIGIYAGAYLWNRRRLQTKATETLRRLEEALAGRGHVINCHWVGSTHLEAALRFASSSFRKASIRVEFSSLLPSLSWVYSRNDEDRERLVFSSDLEAAPRFRLTVLKNRWTAQSGKIKCQEAARWEYEPVMPVIYTTSSDWSPELAATVLTARANQQQDLQDVRFRKSSPHLSASLPLDVFFDGDNHMQFFAALSDLATEASTSTNKNN
jgi:hypothetical protein